MPESAATAFARAWCDSFRAMLAVIDHVHPNMLALSLPTRYGREDQGSAMRYLTGLLTEERTKTFQTLTAQAMNGPLPRCCDWRGGGAAGGQHQAFEALGNLIDSAYDAPITAFDGKLAAPDMPAWLTELAGQVHRAFVSLLDEVLNEMEAGTPIEHILLDLANRRDGTPERPVSARPMPPVSPPVATAGGPYRAPVAVARPRSAA